MALYEYKNYARNGRTQNIEESFAKGVQYTNTPLDEGFVRCLVNYDLHENGDALIPRPGLQSKQLYKPATGVTGFESIIASKEQHISRTETRPQFITMEPAVTTGHYNLKALTGATGVGTGFNTGDTRFDEIQCHEYVASDAVEVLGTVPSRAEIHGIPVANTSLVKHAGTYAWNEQYYFFDTTGNIRYTKFDETADKFIIESEVPRSITAKEAVTYGYNMLSPNPYTFANTNTAEGGILEFQGMMPYDGDTLSLTPLLNQSLKFVIFYSVPKDKKYDILIEWKNLAESTWNKLLSTTRTFTDLSELSVAFSPPSENIIIRVSAYGYTADKVNEYTDATLAVGFNFAKESYGDNTNTAPKIYQIKTATGMTYWQNRLVVWGVDGAPTMLFMSEINDPTYFPFPNNSDTFSEPIKYVVPFLDSLLVFTSSKLYYIQLSADGLNWMRSCIQSNLTIADWDIHLIQIVKNMVFFRSGNYYYMMVPKATSSTGELTLAPVSKPLYYFFDNFDKSVKEIIEAVYNKDVTLTLMQYHNYLDFEDVHNVYVFQTDFGEYINFDALYNTVARYWRFYITGCAGLLKPYKQDMTQKGTMSVAIKQADNSVTYQLLQYGLDNRDSYVRDISATNIVTDFDTYHVWRAWQHIDTGYREHMSNFKKRYRELQFVINNRSNKAISFYTDFFIDGEQRKNRYTYDVVQELDPLSPEYGVITVEKILSDSITAPGSTVLGTDANDVEAWQLGISQFPDTSFWKARFPVSGKGYTPRMIFSSRNELPYELLNISWIYRQLYSR